MRVAAAAAGYTLFGEVTGHVDQQAEARFDGSPPSIALARSFVRTTLAAWEADGLSDVAVLLVSELASNSLVHAQGTFGIRLAFEPPELMVEVSDDSMSPPARVDAGPRDASGRGLKIVDALATRWGYWATDRGKVVWFCLDFRAPGEPEMSRVHEER